MGTVTWKDASSYSQSDKERVPNCWRLELGGLDIAVHRHIHYEKTDWLVSCAPFVSQRLLKSKDAEEAKAEGLAIVRKHVDRLAKAWAQLETGAAK